MIDSKHLETIRHQASEIERLRFALYGCLVASKTTDPLDYVASLDYVYEQSQEALYGDLREHVPIERNKITYKWKESDT